MLLHKQWFCSVKILYSRTFKISMTLDNEDTKSLCSPSASIAFPQMQNHFLQSCAKENIRSLWERIVNLLKGILQAIKRHHVVRFQDEVRLPLLKRTIWKQIRNVLSSEKGMQLIALITPPIISRLS